MKQATRKAVAAKLKELESIPTQALTRVQALAKLNARCKLAKFKRMRQSGRLLSIDDIIKTGHSVTQ